MKTWKKLKKDPQLWDKYFIREKILKAIREFFYLNKFHEVETPLLVPEVIPESYLEVFGTYLRDRKEKKHRLFLTTSPEASIKKLLVTGLGNCFEITKSFRNYETGSCLHNPEFTILEWYRIGANYRDIMRDCEELIIYICAKIKNQKSKIKNKMNIFKINYQGKEIDLSPPWERISVAKAFKKYAGLSFDKIDNRQKIAQIARKKGYQVSEKNTWEEIFHQIFLNELQPHLGGERPTIIYDYPKTLAALSKIKSEDSRFAERFEFYIGGLELGDCYTELTDYKEQEKRFRQELNLIKSKNKTRVKEDKDFLRALKMGLPPCSGIAVGVDRLVMLFTNSKTIQETLLFPMSEMIEV